MLKTGVRLRIVMSFACSSKPTVYRTRIRRRRESRSQAAWRSTAVALFYTEASMSYQAAIEQLNAMVPELYSRPGQPRRKFSLDEIGVLLDALGDPHRRFPSVLIAGTNGKGSTAATLASILTAVGGADRALHLAAPGAGQRAHPRWTGRRLPTTILRGLSFACRWRPGNWCRTGTLAQMPSFFEMLTALAFLYFAEQGVEIAVLEVGMGGRLDATNIVDPLLSVITDISLDHMEWLGSTIAAIAREKAGILRAGGTLITLPQHPEANQVLGEVATELGVRGVSAVPLHAADGPWEMQCGRRMRLRCSGDEDRGGFAAAGSASASEPGAGDCGGGGAGGAARISDYAGGDCRGIQQTRWPGRLERIEQTAGTARMDSGCGAQSCRSLGAAGGLAADCWSEAGRADADLQLPARQACRGDGADSVSAF